jgi:hypothetical protein
VTAKTVRSFSVPLNPGIFRVPCGAMAEAVALVPNTFGAHAALVLEMGDTDRGHRTEEREFRVVRDADPVRGGRYVGSFSVSGPRSILHVYEV